MKSALATILLSAIALAARPATAQLPGGTWQYLWGDEFNSDSLDTKKWSYNYPWGTTHNHDAVMSPDNVVLGDGTLTLVAERTGSGANFTSGAITTGYNKFTFNGGYVEARILLPDTPGSWPAFWGLYSGWPPEADIMEYPIDTAAGSGYSQDQYHTAFHYDTGSGNTAGAGQVNPSGVGDLGGSYHNFGMQWIEDDWVGFYFDGQLVSQFGTDSAVAQMEYMYLILNYAVGGWPGTPNTSEWAVGHTDEMKVDWVRVWQQESTRSTDWAYTGASEFVQWDTAANWSNGSPNLGGVTANFNTLAGLAEQRLDWSGIRTLTAINLDGDTRYRLGWPDDRLIMAGANNASGNASINVAATSTAAYHEIRAELELFSDLAITNASNQELRLSGKIMGGGDININGPGVVIFANSNTYTGNTTIDSGSQGPGVARVTASQALGTGNIIIGSSGNSTTGRLEIAGDSELANTISVNGRNNNSVALQNLSGNNTFSGAINAQVGGGSYIIQSDAGLMTFAGILQAGATDTRTFTLQGDGAGLVSGTIQNGNGIIALNKAGQGTWTFAGDNTYTGITNITAGTLAINGTHTGGGAYTIAAGATLGGNGTIDPAASNHITVQGAIAPGNTPAPGTGIGQLTIGSAGSTNNVVFGDGGELTIELDAAGAADLLVVHGTLDLSSDSDALRLIDLGSAFDGTDYLIATFTPGTLDGEVFDLIYLNDVLLPTSPNGSLGNGYWLTYDDALGQITLHTPEPTSLALLCGGSILTLGRRRRYLQPARHRRLLSRGGRPLRAGHEGDEPEVPVQRQGRAAADRVRGEGVINAKTLRGETRRMRSGW